MGQTMITEASDFAQLGVHDYVTRLLTSIARAPSKVASVSSEVVNLVALEKQRLECLNVAERSRLICAFGAAAVIEAGSRSFGGSFKKLAARLGTIENKARRILSSAHLTFKGAKIEFDASRPFFQRLLTICHDCRSIFATPKTLDHSRTHLLNPGENLLEDKNLARLKARPNVETAVFPEGTSIEQITKLATASKEVEIVDLAKNGSEASRAFDSIIRLSEKEAQPMRVRTVVCVQASCLDEGGRSFKKGEVISVFPICGPGVVQLPTLERLMRAEMDGANSQERKRGRVKERLCTSLPGD
jgi:hypothetical protein